MELASKDVVFLYCCVNLHTIFGCCCYNIFIVCLKIVRMYKIYIRILWQSFE